MPGVNYYDGSQFQEVAALERSDGQTAPAYRWDGSQWVKIYPAIPDSAVSRWTFDTDDTSSGQAIDTWGSNDATINGATTGVAGANQTYNTNEAYRFDGTDDYLSISAVPTLSSFTIAFWSIHRSVNDDDGDVVINLEGNNWVYLRDNGGGTFQIQCYDGSSFPTLSTTVSNDVWNHWVGWWDGSTLELFKNATSQGTTSLSQMSSTSDPDMIGKSSAGGGYFDGDLDDLRIYDKALTDSEISNLYNKGHI